MNIISKDYIGSFMLNDKVDVTDPCYDKGVWCRETLECKPGEYFGYAEISYEGGWGKRVARISIYRDDEEVDLNDMERVGNIGVDAGIAGFFRDKPDYPDDEWSKFLHEAGLYKPNGEYDYKKDYFSVEYGVFSRSGYGDGGYDVYANKERTAFTIVFIED